MSVVERLNVDEDQLRGGGMRQWSKNTNTFVNMVTESFSNVYVRLRSKPSLEQLSTRRTGAN